MKNTGVLDYAGGNVVHICSGASGLATVAVVGNRRGFGKVRLCVVCGIGDRGITTVVAAASSPH